ncbi:hypothetical protein CIL05_19465 [Virgibacillus profundi]|uniref:YknX-like barrel-sandwich hybrid domain-containing protein n=1 Tax=Virgibacillus profundi TaxID=2024555 RepID=A0A2A2I8F5_9BACI|nr:efflux RND transporter periplasmic adaptor subunit [Virgibacillus profundi]PAV27862.1 hypothetical protein CIL05_19465 [Virgibacillus profundi]PXY52040.1 efflux RND transporter periplasmic adaptor subunit [Virgibacillus profundi]
MMRRRIILTAIVLFIGVNILLVFLDDENKIDRKSYIKDWAQAFEADVADKLVKPGVIAFMQENQVYFDKTLGSFQEFFVKEGNQINPGDPLYSYTVTNYYETESMLMQETEQINGDITAIQSAITQMNSYRIPPSNSSNSIPLEGDLSEGNIIIENQKEPVEAEMMKEQYLIEKEKELDQKNAQLDSIQAQLDELRTTGNTITVESPYEGTIKTVSTSLSDPIITIESAQLHAEGELTEQERTTIEQGMAVAVQVTEKEALVEGVINEVDESPKAIQVEGESVYPFNVTFNEDAELNELLPGYHANLAITKKESLGATVLFEDTVFANSVWKMTNEGKLMKQSIETGIYMDRMQEITKGVNTGDWVAEGRTGQFRHGATFITPLKLNQNTWNDVVIADAPNWGKSFVIGLLSR